jgi:hypothetical protein
MRTSRTKTRTSATTATNICAVWIAVEGDVNFSRVAKAAVSFAERLHRSMAIPVSVERSITFGAIVLRIWSGDADSLREGVVTCTELRDLRKQQAHAEFAEVMEKEKPNE